MKNLKTLLLSGLIFTLFPAASFAASDPSGWQGKGTDSWYVDNYTQIQPKTMSGGGIKVCFEDMNYDYAVTMYEYDNNNPDDQVGSTRDITYNGQCETWSGVNTETGDEELYLIFTKGSSASDYLTVKWYD